MSKAALNRAKIEKLKHGRYLVDTEREWDADYDSAPMHRIKDRPRFLEGNKLTKGLQETDSQRQKLYDAQKKITDGHSYDTMSGVATEVAEIIGSAWWQRRYGTGAIKLMPGRGSRRAHAKGKVIDGKLTFPTFSRNQRTIIHELIHLTVPRPHAPHGRLYASRYLEAVSWRLGQEAGEALREAYREKNVRWHPRRKFHAGHVSASSHKWFLVNGIPEWADEENVMNARQIRQPMVR